MNRRPYTLGSVGVGPFGDYANPRRRNLIVPLTSLYNGLSLPALFLFDAATHMTGTNGSAATAITEGSTSARSAITPANFPKVKENGIRNFITALFDANKTIRFDNNVTTTSANCSVICVVKQTSNAANHWFMEHSSDTASQPGFYQYGEGTGAMGRRQNQAGQTPFWEPTSKPTWRGTSDTWYTRITRCNYTGNSFTARLNGSNLAGALGAGSTWGTVQNPNVNSLWIGSRTNTVLFFRGEIAMVAVYDGLLTDTDCTTAELILKNRYRHY